MREPIVPDLNAEEYLSWEARREERFELHHGFVVAFAGGTLDHDTLAFNLRTALARGSAPPCRTFGSDVKVQVGVTTIYYSDAGVVCEEQEGSDTIVRRPLVVCEVLSERTRTYDLIDKRAAYRELESLTCIAIVHQRLRRVEVDVRRDGGPWQRSITEDGSVFVGRCEVALDDLYAGTAIALA